MPSITLGSLVLDMVLNFANFQKDMGKAGNIIVRNTEVMAKSLEKLHASFLNVSKIAAGVFAADFGIRIVGQLEELTKKSLEFSATLSGPLGEASKEFLDSFEHMQQAFEVGLSAGFLNSLNGGLEVSKDDLKDIADIGEKVGGVLNKAFYYASIGAALAYTGFEEIKSDVQWFIDKADALQDALLGRSTSGLVSADASAAGDALTSSFAKATEAILSTDDAINQIIGDMARWSTTVTPAARDFTSEFTEFLGLIKQTQGPYQTYIDQLARIKEFQDDIGISAAQSAQLQLQAGTKLATQWESVGSTASGALASMFKDNKAFAIANAVINTAESITKSLAEYGFTPIGVAAMAAAALAGAAQIATILSTEPGSAKSAAVKTGKAGGAVSTAGSASRGGNSGPSQVVTLNIQGDVFGPEHFRKIVAGINGVQRDGTALIQVG